MGKSWKVHDVNGQMIKHVTILSTKLRKSHEQDYFERALNSKFWDSVKVVVSKIKSLRILNDRDDTEMNSALIGIMLAKRFTALTVFAQLLTCVTVARHFSNMGLRYLRCSFTLYRFGL
jgi:hypothetical protein